MCGHYLVEPVACTPASGWEKGQVENQVGTLRQNFFAPRVRVKSLRELNDWLADRCVEWAKARPHPEIAGKTIWEVFEAERGMPAVEAACAEALEHGVHSADVVLNILARSRDADPPPPIATPEALRLQCEPVADCARYDNLRRAV